MKKICFVTTVSLTQSAFILELAKYLYSTGEFDVSLICSPDEAFQQKLPKYLHFLPVPMERGISLGGVNAVRKMYQIFKREKFDLVQYSTPNASFYASIAAKWANVPVRLYCQWGMAFVGFHGLKREIFKLEEKTVCRLSTWVEPDSMGNLKFSHAEGLYPKDKGSVIWYGSASGVNITKFDISKKLEWRKDTRRELGIPETAFVYGFIGRITGDKGINELFEAARNILEKKDDAWLILVGNPEKSGSVDETLFQWAKNQPRVVFCGFTNVVEKFVSAMDVYVLPSYREGFGLAVVEAEAMGVPVIVTDIPGPTDAMIADQTGLIVKKKDIVSLQNAMDRLFTDADLRSRMSDSAVRFATEKFEQHEFFARVLDDRKKLLKMK
jgi:glycosyltransferase involved in cell wall biosynthesis